ncbi:bacterial Ig-like domain-containing protein [Lactiplantibacillus pentosus]|uniref:bacterial Ig-like domain-containing protein n=1 Tax=Lactiplantibacillus pentosus TaxID=1589 RepID=UPI003D2F4A3B
MKNNQEYVMMAARKNRRFWLAAGTALLVWQVNNQTAQADVQQTPTSSADTTVVTANATAASNVVQLQSGAKTSTKTTPTTESTKTDSTNPQQAGSDSQATSASGTVSSAAKTGESGQAASDLTAEADNRAKSVSTTPYTDGGNNVENKQNTTTVTTSADKSATGSQSTTETGTTPAQSVETDKAVSAGDSVPVDSATNADRVNDTSLSNDGYDAVSTDANSSQPSETDKTGTDETQSSTDRIGSQTVTDEKTSAGLTADSLSSLQPRLAQVQASSLQLDTVDATPTVAQDYAAWDAITDTTRKGIMGTSEWWIDDSDNTLHLGTGQLADANVQFDDNAEVTDWGNVGWGQYVEAHNAKLTLLLEGSVAVGANARGLFNGLTFKLSNEENPNMFFSQISVEQTTDMSYMFERATFMTSWVYLNLWSSSADSVNASHMFENVKCIGNADSDKRVLVTLPALAEAYSDMSYMFNNSEFSKITIAADDSDASKLTSQVTNMAYMFNNCTQLMALYLSKFDTHNVTDMSHMFNGDENLGKLVISTYSPNNPDQTFDTSNVTNMSHMFTRCDALGSLDVSGFITSKVTNMSHMFEYCYATILDVANFDTSQVTDMQAMFNGAVHVKTLDLSNFDTHLITNMDNMFTNCESLTSLILPTHFVDQQVTSMRQMFTNCATLTSIDLVDDFDTRNVTNMDQLFSGCQKLTSLDVSQLDTSHITNMADFFNDCESLTNIEGLTHLNTAAVTTMANMFSNCRSLTALDLSNFETSRVTTMANMFNNCASLPALDVSSLDTSQVVNMANMFAGCAALSTLDTTPLKTTNVTNMSGMFMGDRALVSLDISKFATSQVTTMSHMFEDVFADQKVQSFTGLEKLDTSNVTDMSYMFAGFFLPVAMSLNLVNFDTRKVLNMQGMFKGYVNFKNNYLGYLQTGNVTDMSYMLSGLVNHTQFTWSNNLDTHSVTTMAYMFSDSPDMETFVWKQQLGMDQVTDMQGMFANDIALAHVDFDQFDTSQVTDMTAMFSGDTLLATLDLTSFDTSNVESMYKMFYLDSALKNLNLSSFSGEKLQLTYATLLPLRVFGLFNLIMDDTNDSEPQMGRYQTHLNTLILGQKTRLSLSKPTSVIDWVDASTAEGKEIIAEFSTVEALEQALAQFGLKPDWLVSADLAPSQGFDGVWINNATAETLTSEQLMARYDGTDPLATDATWTWQNILGRDLQVISGTNSSWAPKDSLAGLIDTSMTVDDLTTTVTDATTNQTLTSSQLNALLQQPAHSGQYQVAYQYTDGDGTKQISVPVTLSLVANQSLITTKDSVLQLGTTWTAADNIASLLDADGSVTDLTKVNGVVSVNGIENGTVGTTIPGVYQIDYQITDSTGTVRTATATVIVNGLTLKETQVNVSTDDRWDPLTNIDKAIDDQGNEATVELTITDANDAEVANIKKPGSYQLNYHFTDAHGEHTATAAVNVKADENHADLQVKDSRVYQFGTWTPTDNFVSAMDSDGETLDISALSVTGTVDLNQVGKYTITYQFTDQFGVAHSAQATVEVLENQAAISLDNNSGTLYANGIWNPASVVVNATDVDGSTVEDARIKCSGTVDMTTPGENKLTYSFVDSLGKEHSKDTTVMVLENLAGIKVKSTTESFRIGAKWSEENNFDSATDVDGTSVDLSNVAIESTVNSEVVGQYKVTYSFTDQQGQLRSIVVPVEVLANLADIRVKSKTESFRIGAKWSAEDNFDSATDVDGTPIDLADVDIESTVNSEVVGQYKVTYSFTDQQGQLRSIVVPVEVLANLADIRVKSKTESFRIGAKWSAEDNFDSATDVDGTPLGLSNVDVKSTVNTEVVGQYKVTYSFTDQQGKLRSVEVPVEVLANLASIKAKAPTENFRIGAKWSEKDNFDSATDVDGTPINLSNIDIESTVNSEVAGQYKVTYSFTDQQGKLRSVEVPVEVLVNLAGIKVKSTTESFRIGAKWSEKDNFESATNVDGTAVALSDVDVTSTVDPEKVGQYKVTYSFTDQQGQLRKADVTVDVLANLAGIKVKFTTESFRIGAKWSEKDNFDGATDVDGTPIDLADVDVISTVDPKTVGQYKVTYSFTDQQGKLRSVEVPVEVLANLAGIKAKSATESFRIGAKWSAKDNFDGATDVDGTPIDLADVDITSTVDPEKVGQYKVTYSFTDQQGELRSVEVPVEVLANLAGIRVKSTTESFRIGAKWSAKDNFESATNVDGTAVALSDVDVTSTVDPETVGQYKVTYSFTDQQGKLRSVEVPVEVLANLAGIRVKFTTESFRIGAKWSAKDNFDSATDVDGTPINLSNIDIESTVNLEVAGQYKVTYSFTDQQGKLRNVEVPVDVLANMAGIKVKSKTESFRIGAKWSEKDNFDGATDVDGTPIDLADVDVISTVDPEKVGQYKVTYSFTDQQGQLRKAEVPVEVLANLAGIKVKFTTESFRIGAKWSAEDNFDSATDVDGTPINLSNIDVENTVNSERVGQYKVTYSFIDQQGELRSIEVPVEVLANLAGIKVKSTAESFRIGAKWSEEDNFDSATDVDGTPINLSNIDIESTVNSEVVGQYKVTYSFTDQQGKLRSAEVPVGVLANLAGIKVKSTTESFRIGAKWSEKDNFDSATDVDGTPINLSNIDIESTVNSEVVGQYKVTYSFTDQQGKLRSVEVPVEVLANLAGIRVKSTTESFRIGATWSEKDNFDGATDVDGTPIDLADVDITSTVDPEKVGQYKVTYSFTDQQGELRSVEVPVEVLANLASIKVKSTTESFHIGEKWSEENNFDSATDVDGTPLGLSNVDVESTVNPEVVGQYKVTYSFTDQQGQLRKADVTVNVLANLAGIKVKASTENFRIGAKWSEKDNFDSATDVDGTPIDLADVNIISTVDPKAVGQYEVTYSFTDQQGQIRSVEVPVEVLANLAGIKVKSATESFRIGAKWSGKDNFESATNVDGTAVALSDVDVTSTVDPEKVGQYKATYSFIDQQGQLRKAEVTVDVLANLAGIKVKSTTESFRIGAKWSEKDNFDSATDVDGTPINLADVNITSTVDSTAVGQYKVTYSFTDQQGTVQQVIVPVNVLANYANLQLNQTELSFRAGDNRWQPESNIAAATDIDGRAIDLATMQITNAVDSTTPGMYLVNYAFTDSFNQTHRATATVTVLDNMAALTMVQQHVTLYLGNRQWQPEDNFGGAKNVDGSAITFDQLQVLGHYDLKVVGDYELTYQFTDQLDHLRTARFTVTVAENQSTIVVEKTAVTLHVGDTWVPMMNFVSATDMDGQAIAENRISVNVTKLNQRLRLMMMRSRALPIVDTMVVGSYQVSYQFIDGNGNLQELATTVSVLPNESALKLAANDITLYAGDEWQPMANVVKATNVDGTPVMADQLRISGSVNPNVVGQYRVLYSFVDQQNKLQQAVTTVNVLANQAALLLKHDQVALTVGDEWQPLANLQLARDVDGHEIASTDLVIDGQVDTAAPGTYQVRYHFTDMRGHEQQAVAMVTVVEPIVVDQALLRLHAETVTLRAGATWAPLSNVAEVLDSDGSAQTSEQVSVQGTVELNQAGKYLLTYHFLDQLGHDHSATATIIVLENEASLKLWTTAVTLKVGQKWDATANILAATDVDGRSINEAVVITGDVDWRRPGIYQLTYELVDQLGKMHSAKTKITLIAADDGSDNQGGNGNTDNGSGNQGGNGNTDNGSGNQGGNGNTDNGSGNQGDNGNTDNGSGNQGGNGNTGNGSGNQGGNGNTDNGSGNQGGNGNTDNGSGNQGGNGNTDNGSDNQGGNGNTDNGSGNQGSNDDANNGSGDQGDNVNINTNSDHQGDKADDNAVSNDNLNTDHQIDADTIHDADNNSGQNEVAKPNTVSHENGANATVAKHQSVTTNSVKSTTNTKTNKQPSVGSPTQLPQTDEHNAGTTNWWPWLGIALAGLITMVKPTKKKEK